VAAAALQVEKYLCRAAANAEMMHWSDALVLTLAGRIQNYYEILLCSSQTCFSRGSAALRNERNHRPMEHQFEL
jgi:hypothetical protein